jgi:hypothetical protein
LLGSVGIGEGGGKTGSIDGAQPPRMNMHQLTVDHVCVLRADKAAWFKDTEGNLLCLHQDI